MCKAVPEKRNAEACRASSSLHFDLQFAPTSRSFVYLIRSTISSLRRGARLPLYTTPELKKLSVHCWPRVSASLRSRLALCKIPLAASTAIYSLYPPVLPSLRSSSCFELIRAWRSNIAQDVQYSPGDGSHPGKQPSHGAAGSGTHGI